MATDAAGWQAAKVVSGLYKSAPSTLASGDQDVLRLTSAGLLRVAVEAGTIGAASGGAASGAAVAGAGNPVLVAGQDGTSVLSILTDANGAARPAPGKTAWSATHVPAVNTVATCAQAAGATGIKNVCTKVSFQLANDSTGSADIQTFVLRDGATGAGTILATWKVNIANTASIASAVYTFKGPWVGSAATAMTLETSTTPTTHTAAIVNMTGYQTK